jgi:hypothetical protein
VYEVGALLVNAAMHETVLPSPTKAIAAFSWRTFGRRFTPRWGPTAALVVVGSVASAVIRHSGVQPSKR